MGPSMSVDFREYRTLPLLADLPHHQTTPNIVADGLVHRAALPGIERLGRPLPRRIFMSRPAMHGAMC